jgi:hypothetical protein
MPGTRRGGDPKCAPFDEFSSAARTLAYLALDVLALRDLRSSEPEFLRMRLAEVIDDLDATSRHLARVCDSASASIRTGVSLRDG